MDNLVLDELGVVALRQGSAKINGSAFSDVDVHSLFTATLSGSRYRMSGCTDAVYANGSSIASSLNGSGDVAFGAHMGQILFARGTSKKKYDGSTVRTWGIAAPSVTPTIAALTADSKVFASCASTESPIMTSNEGTQAFQPDKAATANAAVELTPDSTTGRAVSTKTFAAATDFTTYDAAQVGTDDDLIDFYAYVTEPQLIDSLVLMIDVNDGTFQEDYYERVFRPGDAIETVAAAEDSLASNYDVEGEDRDRVLGDIERREQVQVTFRTDKPASNVGWNHFSVPRGSFSRTGSTSGKNWSTVKAVRIVVNAIAGGSGAAVRFDEIKLVGGSARPLTGKYKAAVVFVRNDGTYEAKSAPSTFSSELEVKAQGIRATVSSGAISAADTQVNEIWLYLMGGRLNAFYRAGKLTGGPFTGAQTIDATSSEITMLAANLRMETDNTTPPDTILAIEGPHFDRTLCLTAQYIYPSRRLNPDSFSAGEAVRVGDASETALWLKKVSEGGLYVGTTRDIYRIDGDWTPLPDGSINIAKRPLGVSAPPVSSAAAVGMINGVETIVYLSGDGWRTIGSGPLTGAVELLWRGYTRHGVSGVNIADASSRFRVAITKNQLTAITPEDPDTTSSATLHKYDFTKNRWYRHTFPQAFRSICAEKDGTLIAGDEEGFVRTMDLSTKQDDGVNIPVVLWTGVDDNGEPFTSKDPESLQVRLDTGDVGAAIAFHLNGNSAADHSLAISQQQTDTDILNVGDVAEFSQIQLRITGNFSTFVLRDLALRYLDNPMPLVIHDTGPIDLTRDVVKWVRLLRIKAKSPVDLTIQPYWDGAAGTVRTIAVGDLAGIASAFDVPLGRQDKGRVARIVITSARPSHLYWVEFLFNGTGKQIQKRVSLVPEAV